MAQDSDPLSRGITLFTQGRDNDALSALNEAVRTNPRTPLAYYYAARIRIKKGQYDRAISNLERALQDSSGFHDANGYLAIAWRELGDEIHARQAWQAFIGAVGILDSSDPASIESIMPPQNYHDLLAIQEQQKREEEQRARQEAERLRKHEAEEEQRRREQATADSLADIQRREQATADSLAHLQAIADSIEAAQITADSLAALEQAAAPVAEEPATTIESENIPVTQNQLEPPETETDPEAPVIEPETGLSIDDTPLRDIENQISADIRSIIIWFSSISVVLLVSIGISLYISHRRRKKDDDTVFSEQVERLLDDMQFEVTENQAISEFDRKKQEIAEEIAALRNENTESTHDPESEEEQSIPEPAFPVLDEQPAPEREPIQPSERTTTHKSLITEEIKTLVSRLAREGTPAAEIARTADLTVTEVNLILAVRERRIQNIAADIHHDEDTTQRDQLLSAITGLQNEGANPREIARKLDISLSEVELALSITALKQQSREQ